MPWWAWVLVAWVVLAVATGLFVGTMAAAVRKRERAAREHRPAGGGTESHGVA